MSPWVSSLSFLLALASFSVTETVTLLAPTHQRSLNPGKPRADGNEIYSAQQLLPDFCCDVQGEAVSWCKGD